MARVRGLEQLFEGGFVELAARADASFPAVLAALTEPARPSR